MSKQKTVQKRLSTPLTLLPSQWHTKPKCRRVFHDKYRDRVYQEDADGILTLMRQSEPRLNLDFAHEWPLRKTMIDRINKDYDLMENFYHDDNNDRATHDEACIRILKLADLYRGLIRGLG